MQTEQISSLLLFSLFEGKNRWIGVALMMFLPYVNSLIDRVRRYIVSWWYPSTVSIVLRQKFDKNGLPVSNVSYKALCWYIIENYTSRQKSLSCEGDVLKKNDKLHTDGKYRRVPDYMPNDKIKIQYKGIGINLSFSDGKEEKSITLSTSVRPTSVQPSTALETKNNRILLDFVADINAKFEEYCYSMIDPNKMYVCEWKSDKRHNDTEEFTYTEMRINKTYKNIYLPDALITNIQNDIKQFKTGEDFYKQNGIPYKRGYLFYGPPGTGKTSTVYAIARENKMNLYKLDLKMIAITKALLKSIVGKIPRNSVILIEEIDTQIHNDRQDTSETHSTDKKDSVSTPTKKEPVIKPTDSTVPEIKKVKKDIPIRSDTLPMSMLMEVLDGYDCLHGCIIILTTNHKEYLNEALIRPGRIDIPYLFDLMGAKVIQETIKRFTGFDIPVDPKISMTSSKLLNQILLPHRTDIESIKRNLI